MKEQYLYLTSNTVNEVTPFIIPLLGQWNFGSYTHLHLPAEHFHRGCRRCYYYSGPTETYEVMVQRRIPSIIFDTLTLL